MEYLFDDVTRQAAKGDNVVIVLRDLNPDDQLILPNGNKINVKYTALEGHRIAFSKISKGDKILSWELPFGYALQDVHPGEALFNIAVLNDLKKRDLDISIPGSPNFEDWTQPFSINDSGIKETSQVPVTHPNLFFQGYRRSQKRGSGIRNHVVVLGTSSRVTAFIKLLSSTLPDQFLQSSDSFDRVIAVHHSEGGGFKKENNHDLVLRTLSGWVIHPNISSILLIDHGEEAINNNALFDYLKAENYPVNETHVQNMSIANRQVKDCLHEAREYITAMVQRASKEKRSSCPISDLKIALQCGGSDAFSGMSGNPLAGLLAKELIQHGGSANLAETSELIGAESYVLQKVKNLQVAQKFLNTIDRFQSMAHWHGHSAEGNPSGGNLFRGLYNISVKSIGAANKKHPDLRLDEIIDYGEPMTESGFYFMDSAGNDLESIAGQVASGCQLVLFITGNGSITNFPFVPTLKIVTTSSRFRMLEMDMDINAGEYLDGTPLMSLKEKYFDLIIRTCEGRMTVGEKAGHSQAQIWRNWHMNSKEQLDTALNLSLPSGIPLEISWPKDPNENESQNKEISKALTNRLEKSVIVPTSLCSSEVASQIAKGLNDEMQTEKIIALSHTEGCGVSRGPSEELFIRTMVGYALHPSVNSVLFLEHGCEKTHHSEFQNFLSSLNKNPESFTWESIQSGGGLNNARARIKEWALIQEEADSRRQNQADDGVLRQPCLGIFTLEGNTDKQWAVALLNLVRLVIEDFSGNVIIAETDPFLQFLISNKYLRQEIAPSLRYGECPKKRHGFHIMETQTNDSVEILTGLGASGMTHAFLDSKSLENNFTPPPLSQLVLWGGDTEEFYLSSGIPHSHRPFQVTRGHQGFSL